MLQCFDEACRHGLTILLGIADVGKNLCEGFLVVDADKVDVLGQCLLLGIKVVYLLWCVVGECLIVYDAA